MPAGTSDDEVSFESGGLDGDEVFVRLVRGREAISRYYEFDITLQTNEPLTQDKVDGVLTKTARLTIGTETPRSFSGVVRSIEMQSTAEMGRVEYKLVLVPQLWYATQTFRSKVFQDQTVPEIVKTVFTSLGMNEGTHFEIHASAKHPKREFTVQYQETDYAFVSRLMEYEGMYFFFEEGDEGEKIVIGDANEVFVELDGYATIAYDPRTGRTNDGTETIASILREQRSVLNKLALRDYNYRTPSLALAVDGPVDEKGHGMHVYYGEHFKDIADGKRLAKLRAEENLVEKVRYTGASHVRGLRPGHKFTLTDHVVDDLNQTFYVTDVEHTVAQGGDAASGDASSRSEGYSNRFSARSFDVVFRPQRVTPKPSIAGVMHAKIDAASKGTAAPIDEHGRYRVLLPYDVAGKPGGKASRWIRMAQHYSGPGYGSHFPLHSGAEVILVHLDGDPDRPIIAAAVPNAEMVTPVVSGNATQSVIRSHAGIHIEFEDDA